MRLSFFFFLVCLVSNQAFGQLHQDVFPNEQGSALLDDLESSYKPSSVLTYKDARNKMFGEIDNVNDSVHCVYTDDVIYLNPNNSDHKGEAYGKGFNTEHTFPQSKGATGNAKSDLHHLFPTKIDVNSDRGSYPFAEIDDNITDRWYWKDYTQSGIPNSNIDEFSEADLSHSFEPREAHKGNVARAMMYFYTMYHAQSTNGYFESMRPTLCAWHYEDAVDQQEWDRTWAIAAIQSNKPNPFVLDCTLPERSYCSGLGYMCNPDATDEPKPLISLFGVSPNPVSLVAKIRFTLESLAPNAELVVYDMMGRKIEAQNVKNLSPGQNELFVDTSSWQSGFYIYTVQVGRAMASGKFLVF